MNIVEVQDNLKNFSQDQLINEINQPSGMVPQFLVLTELGRRNRIKQDMESQQAQNQPTVAQDVVSAAGVPQGGIMDMARSMAPKSSIEQNDAVNMMKEGGKPKNRMDMLLAYLRSLGADEEEEIKEATGGKSIAEIINFGGDYRPVKKADGGVVKMQTAGSPTREVVYEGQRYLTDGSGRVFKAARRNSMRRGQEITDPDIVNAVLNTGPSIRTDVGGISNISANTDTFNPEEFANRSKEMPINLDSNALTDQAFNFMGSQALNESIPVAEASSADMSSVLNMTRGVPAMRDPAVIDPTTGLPYDALGSMAQQTEQTRQAEELEKFEASSLIPDELMVPFNNDTRLSPAELTQFLASQKPRFQGGAVPGGSLPSENQRLIQEAAEMKEKIDKQRAEANFMNPDRFNRSIDFDEYYRGAGNYPVFPNSTSTDQQEKKTSVSELTPEQFREQEKEIAKAQGMPQERLKNLVLPASNDDDNKGGTKGGSALGALESEIANMLKQNEEDREKDKYLALAKMGLALMSSSQPTFGGALGEAGMAGLDDLQASRQSYRDDKLALLDAQRKLEQARATASGKDKSGLTGSNVVSLLNNARTRRANQLAKIAEQMPTGIESTTPMPPEKIAAIEGLKRDVARLDVEISTYESMLGGIGSLSSSSADFDATAAN